MDLKGKFALALASGGGIGFIPVAPGTFGSVLGLGIYWVLLLMMPAPAAFFFVGCLTAAAVWTAGQAETLLGGKDPKVVVIDEIVGMMVSLLALPVLPAIWIFGFLLFRFFDILKPFPIGYLEKKCPGGTGIVIDDVAAGAAANLLLRGLMYCGVLPLV